MQSLTHILVIEKKLQNLLIDIVSNGGYSRRNTHFIVWAELKVEEVNSLYGEFSSFPAIRSLLMQIEIAFYKVKTNKGYWQPVMPKAIATSLK